MGQNGVKLSGGQRQRLSLARAFLDAAADSAARRADRIGGAGERGADPRRRSCERTRDGRGTTLLVTHRVDLLRQAPRILFLEGGRLSATAGTADLVLTCPEYADAYHRWEVKEEAGAGRAGDGECEELR